MDQRSGRSRVALHGRGRWLAQRAPAPERTGTWPGTGTVPGFARWHGHRGPDHRSRQLRQWRGVGHLHARRRVAHRMVRARGNRSDRAALRDRGVLAGLPRHLRRDEAVIRRAVSQRHGVLPRVGQPVERDRAHDLHQRRQQLPVLGPDDGHHGRRRNPLLQHGQPLHQHAGRGGQPGAAVLLSRQHLQRQQQCRNLGERRRSGVDLLRQRLHATDGARRTAGKRVLGRLDEHQSRQRHRKRGHSPPGWRRAGHQLLYQDRSQQLLRLRQQLVAGGVDLGHHRRRQQRFGAVSGEHPAAVRRAYLRREQLHQHHGRRRLRSLGCGAEHRWLRCLHGSRRR